MNKADDKLLIMNRLLLIHFAKPLPPNKIAATYETSQLLFPLCFGSPIERKCYSDRECPPRPVQVKPISYFLRGGQRLRYRESAKYLVNG